MSFRSRYSTSTAVLYLALCWANIILRLDDDARALFRRRISCAVYSTCISNNISVQGVVLVLKSMCVCVCARASYSLREVRKRLGKLPANYNVRSRPLSLEN